MQSEESWDDFVCRQAVDLHAAIDRQDRHAVHELFTLGAVHIEMIDPSVQGCAIQPLIHAAYKGDAAIVRDILDLSAVRFVCEITDRWTKLNEHEPGTMTSLWNHEQPLKAKPQVHSTNPCHVFFCR